MLIASSCGQEQARSWSRFTSPSQLLLTVKKLVDLFASDIDAAATSKQQQKEQFDQALQVIRKQNLRVTEELLQLTDLAHFELMGSAALESGHDVASAFARLDGLIDTFGNTGHQPWARAVIVAYLGACSDALAPPFKLLLVHSLITQPEKIARHGYLV